MLKQDARYLKETQYKDPSNLEARMYIHKHFSTNPQGMFPWIHQQMALEPGTQVLEVGCGPANLWWEVPGSVSPGLKCVLSDFSPGMVWAARENLAWLDMDLRFAVVDIQQLPFPDGSFDVVIANFMLYHVPDRPRAFAEIRRVLRSTGKLFATTVGDNHLLEIHQFVRDFLPDLEYGNWRVPFTVQNGREQLSPWFEDVELRLYEDGLAVTEAEPLVEYIASSALWQSQPLDGEMKKRLFEYIARELETRGGVLKIQKETGMFVATRGWGRRPGNIPQPEAR